MFVEERIYTFKVGKLKEYLEIYEREGMPIQRRYLPRLIGYYTTEIGDLNQVVHLWAYASFEERTRCRQAMRADPGWVPYLAKIHPLLLKQENKLLVPAPFFDLERLVAGMTS